MAQICKEIQERIEGKRREAHEECRNVTRKVTQRICSWLPWPISELCKVVTKLISELVCAIVYVIITIVSWVARIVCETIVIIDWIITHVIGFLDWLGNRILTFPEWLFCLMGFGSSSKKFRICPIVIADETGNPSVSLEDIQSQIDTAIKIYATCNITIITSPIKVVTDHAHLLDASSCGAKGYFSLDRGEYEHLTCCNGFLKSIKCLRFPSGIIFPRHILKVIWVNSIKADSRGCYLIPESFVLIAATAAIDTLAHEMGHASDLLHRDETDNLMNTPDRIAANLTSFQCCTIRTSRFVTFL